MGKLAQQLSGQGQVKVAPSGKMGGDRLSKSGNMPIKGNTGGDRLSKSGNMPIKGNPKMKCC
jgi:hypothetical protein